MNDSELTEPQHEQHMSWCDSLKRAKRAMTLEVERLRAERDAAYESCDQWRAHNDRARADLDAARRELSAMLAERDALRERVRALEGIARQMYESVNYPTGPWLDKWRSVLFPEEPKNPCA